MSPSILSLPVMQAAVGPALAGRERALNVSGGG